MSEEQYQIFSEGSTQLFCTSWQPDKSPRAVLFIVHGLGEHQGRYKELVNKCLENQIGVFAFDHRGHGKSEGKRGHATGIEQLIEDLEHALMKCRSLFLERPIFLYGHSLGGQVVASYLDKIKSKEIAGAIISSPWIRIVNEPPKWQVKFVKKISSFFPSITVSNRLNPQHISSVEDEVKSYKTDPLNTGKISLALFSSLIANGKYLQQFAQPTKIPILVCHGDHDQITSPEASNTYAKNLGEKAQYKIWKNAYHEPHHDWDKDNILQFYVDWVAGQVDMNN